MQQFYRLGGDDQLGCHTEWERKSENRCIYCGAIANTREHVPSKAFLQEPFPDNLPTIPACFECNNGFSFDEDYFACYLDVLKSEIFRGYSMRTKIAKRLQKNPSMSQKIEAQIKLENGIVNFCYDEKRFENILVKLAQGHAGYEFDYVNFDCEKHIWYDFSFRMNKEQIAKFDDVTLIDKMPDLGARVYNRLCIVEDVVSKKIVHTFLEPVCVQEGEYRYDVYFEGDKICVKIVIGDMLYSIVKFEE